MLTCLVEVARGVSLEMNSKDAFILKIADPHLYFRVNIFEFSGKILREIVEPLGKF